MFKEHQVHVHEEDTNSRPPEKELGALTKMLACRVSCLRLDRLLYSSLVIDTEWQTKYVLGRRLERTVEKKIFKPYALFTINFYIKRIINERSAEETSSTVWTMYFYFPIKSVFRLNLFMLNIQLFIVIRRRRRFVKQWIKIDLQWNNAFKSISLSTVRVICFFVTVLTSPVFTVTDCLYYLQRPSVQC